MIHFLEWLEIQEAIAPKRLKVKPKKIKPLVSVHADIDTWLKSVDLLKKDWDKLRVLLANKVKDKKIVKTPEETKVNPEDLKSDKNKIQSKVKPELPVKPEKDSKKLPIKKSIPEQDRK